MVKNLIKVSEIKEDYSNIEIKYYLPLSAKKIIVNNILETCIFENEEGFKIIDYSLLYMIKQFKIINEYTNIDFSEEDLFNVYDQLSEKSIIEYVLSKIDTKEIEFFDTIIEKEIQQMYIVNNSLQSVLSKTLNKVIDKIPDSKEINKIITKVRKELNNISPETLNILKDINIKK